MAWTGPGPGERWLLACPSTWAGSLAAHMLQALPEHVSWHAISPAGYSVVCTFTYSWLALSWARRLSLSKAAPETTVVLVMEACIVTVPGCTHTRTQQGQQTQPSISHQSPAISLSHQSSVISHKPSAISRSASYSSHQSSGPAHSVSSHQSQSSGPACSSHKSPGPACSVNAAG